MCVCVPSNLLISPTRTQTHTHTQSAGVSYRQVCGHIWLCMTLLPDTHRLLELQASPWPHIALYGTPYPTRHTHTVMEL